MKTAKRIIFDNVSANGSLDNDRAAKAFLQHRNTPIVGLGLSPAQLLFHRQLRDHIPAHPKLYRLHKEWITSATEREKMLAQRNKSMEEAYNRISRELRPLEVRDRICIQNGKRWDRTGRIVEVMPNRQYRVRVDGSGRVTLRNRRFLRLIGNEAQQHTQTGQTAHTTPKMLIQPATITPSPTLTPLNGTESTPLEMGPSSISEESSPTPSVVSMPQQEAPRPVAQRVPKMLRDITDFNNPGLRQEPRKLTSRLRSGR